ncbi:MAG: efflux RND transporter periplasmic adaptor subunit [Gallionella sp.]|nr:efflux RND transporter periplasmic adaptor subunit [Gallionella sp.]
MKHIPLFLSLLALAACNKEAPPEAAVVERPALTQIVGAQAGAGSNRYSGEIRARHEAALGFRIGGKLIERLVDAGAQVKAGQILARLDAADTSLQASATDAQFQLAEAEAKRYRELRGKGFVSQAALDAKETALTAAAAQAGLSRNQASYTVLRADRAGVVAATLAEVGQVVSAGQPVLRVAQAGEREVAIAIPESQINHIKVGDAAEVSLWSNGSESAHLAGRLRELSPMADAASRTYAVRIALAPSDANIALGMTAQVRLNAPAQDGELLVSNSAIFQQGDKAAVWVVAADHSVSLRPVQISAYRDEGALISGGLKAGERIVIAGVHKLSAGEKVRALDSGAAR